MKVKIVRSVLVGIVLMVGCLLVVFATASTEATIADANEAAAADTAMAVKYCCCPTIPFCRRLFSGQCQGCSGPENDCSRCADWRTCGE